MANVSYPGVYVDEVSSGVRPIAAASTSTAAFIGLAERGSITEAVKVFNFSEYQNLYGSYLSHSYLSHAVFQFFNNGGSQCYIVRVAGEGAATANLVLKDRGAAAQASLTIEASSAGGWGNLLAVAISNASKEIANKPAAAKLDNTFGNGFDLGVYQENDKGEQVLVESFKNLGMLPGAPDFVETVTAGSKYVKVSVSGANTNALPGTSRGAGAPTVPLPAGKTRFRININEDGYQEVDLQNAVGAGAGQVADLGTAEHVRDAITFVVKALTKLHASSDQNAFANFACTLSSGALLLTSGVANLSSSVSVVPASSASQDASALLKLGLSNGGVETVGAAVTRPRNSSLATPYFFVGDNTAPTGDVAAVQLGSDGSLLVPNVSFINALNRLDNKDDVSLIAIPGLGSPEIVGAGMNYCAGRSLSDCFFIGDLARIHDTSEEAQTFMAGMAPKNSCDAIYTPWHKMSDPTGVEPEPIEVPPSGFIAGLYAKTDAKRGVWKAPAGTEAGVAGATGLFVNFTDVQQGNLNPVNINVIRQFAASGIVVWGARTVTADPEWTYVPVRRTAIMLRVSIYRGIQWAVFEPNDAPLWTQLRLNITSFMMTLYRRGAFQGSTPSQAFFVKCDAETTTQDDINLGIVNVLVGFAPLKPAEFVVVKISQKAGQAS